MYGCDCMRKRMRACNSTLSFFLTIKYFHKWLLLLRNGVFSGRALKLKLLTHAMHLVSNNVLEFMEEIIYVWVDAIEDIIEKWYCPLSMDYRTNPISWHYELHFCGESQAAHEEASMCLEIFCINVSVCLNSQNFKGIGTWCQKTYLVIIICHQHF